MKTTHHSAPAPQLDDRIGITVIRFGMGYVCLSIQWYDDYI